MRDSRHRNIWSYLALPRRDNVIKWLVSPSAFTVSAASSGHWRMAGTFGLIWFIFEYLIYQARYQWNDLRGIIHDREHPDRVRRGRLPPGKDQKQERIYILASRYVAGVRLLIALLLGFAFHMFFIVMLLLLTVLFLSFNYEWVKIRRDRPIAKTSMWLIVGVGYVTRGAIGLISGSLNILSSEVILGSLCFGVLGTMAGMMTAATETTLYSARDNSGTPPPGHSCNEHSSSLTPSSSAPAQARESLVLLINSMHLPTWGLGIRIRNLIRTPWNILCVIGAGLAGVVGMELSLVTRSMMPSVLAITCGFLGGMFCVSEARVSARWAACILVFCGMDVIARFLGGAKFAYLAGVPWAAISGAYTFLRMTMDRQERRLSGSGDSSAIERLPHAP